MQDLSLAQFSQIIQKKNLSATISYGSGGFSVTLVDQNTDKAYGGYAWDINEAFNVAVKHLELALIPPEAEGNDRDVPTNPSMRVLPTKSANVYKLVSKEKVRPKKK